MRSKDDQEEKRIKKKKTHSTDHRRVETNFAALLDPQIILGQNTKSQGYRQEQALRGQCCLRANPSKRPSHMGAGLAPAASLVIQLPLNT